MQLDERSILSYFLGHSSGCRLFYQSKSTLFLNFVHFFSSAKSQNFFDASYLEKFSLLKNWKNFPEFYSMRSLIWAHKSKNWPTLVKALIFKKKGFLKKSAPLLLSSSSSCCRMTTCLLAALHLHRSRDVFIALLITLPVAAAAAVTSVMSYMQ